MIRGWTVLVVVSAVGACGGDGDRGADEDAMEQCESIIATYCEAVPLCLEARLEEEGLSAEDVTLACGMAISEELDCTKVVRVTSGYTSCQTQVGVGLYCPSVAADYDEHRFALPAACGGVFVGADRRALL